MSDSHDHGGAHDAHSHADLDRHVRAALYVFGMLLVLTGFTVGAYYLHLPHRAATWRELHTRWRDPPPGIEGVFDSLIGHEHSGCFRTTRARSHPYRTSVCRGRSGGGAIVGRHSAPLRWRA